MTQKLLGIRFKRLSLLERCWLLAPLVVWFSYQPLIRLGQDGTSYYELSIPLIYLTILALVGVPTVWRHRQQLVSDKTTWLVTAFVALSVVSLFWTPNAVRGILTVGIVGLLWLVFLAALVEQEKLRRIAPALAKLLIASGVFMSLLAFAQIVAGIWLSRSEVLLCAGCIADQFGFVRPNVFAIEPQFFGSLLLAPLMLLLRSFLKGNRSGIVVGSFFVTVTALFLTLSRGAIFAFALGALVLFILYRHNVARLLRALSILVVAFVATLCIQGVAAAVNPRIDVTFREAVAASVNQLTLGVIDIDAEEEQEAEPIEQINSTIPAYDGYVEESTNVRVGMSQLALSTWANNPFRLLFGVGAGGAGLAMHEQYPDKTDARQIVQNQYVEVLLEYGLVGLMLFVAIVVGIVRNTRHDKWIWAVLLAYLVQWNFFSGYPNALHIYIVLIAVYVMSRRLPSERHGLAGRT